MITAKKEGIEYRGRREALKAFASQLMIRHIPTAANIP